MDNFFKAAVCDLDKLLDDFELNADEHDHDHISGPLKPSAYPFSSDAATVPQNLPDLSSLHYGSGPSCPDLPVGDDEDKGQLLIGVDLLSSVDRRPTQSFAPPCPDRALKPVCDLVNDTSSAILVRSNSHDAFSELDMLEKNMEEGGLLLVDFDSPVAPVFGEEVGGRSCRDTEVWQASIGEVELLGLDPHEPPGGYSASLSLLDVILPAAVERSCESVEDSLLPRTTASSNREEHEDKDVATMNHEVDKFLDDCEQEGTISADIKDNTKIADNTEDKSHRPLGTGEAESPASLHTSDSDMVVLSLLPIAVSTCGALVNPKHSENEPGQHTGHAEDTEMCECSEADSLSAWGVLQGCPSGEPVNLVVSSCQRTAENRVSPENNLSLGPSLGPPSCLPEANPFNPSEFGFQYLPESDQVELLVTDEELDAFLQAHTEAEQVDGVPYRSSSGECSQHKGLSDLNGDLEDKLVEEELRSCGRGRLEDLARPESDRPICLSGEWSFNPALPSPLQDSFQLEPDLSSSRMSNSLTSNISHSQYIVSPDPQSSYGGARPKQLHCQATRSSSAGGYVGEVQDQTSNISKWQSAIEDVDDSSTSPPSPTNSPPYASQEHQDDSVGYDELSDPPPYPGELSRDGAGSEELEGEEMEVLGRQQPAWVPDAEAPKCMNCWQRFTFTKRRHHCRACGKVYCTACCNRRCKLKYLEKEARVCVVCFDNIRRDCPREQKRVWFADGILPNGEFADTTKLSVTSRRSSQESSSITTEPGTSGPSDSEVSAVSAPEASQAVEVVRPPRSGPWDYSLLCSISSSVQRVPSLLPEDGEGLPPLLITTGEDEAGDVLVEERPAPCQILLLLEEGGPRPLTFLLNANLLVNIKLVTYCNRRCWFFGSNGLKAMGQRELVFLLECMPDEKCIPQDLFKLYLNIYQDAQKGRFVEDLGNVTFTSSFLSSKEHGGMLFFSPTCQPLDGLTLPPQPFLFGLLIQRLEVPWAKVFPLRLLLRLGAEHSVYPTTLISVRFRDSVYRETGHTIMNLLADLRNFQYSLPVVEGLRIHMEMGHSYIDIPKSRFNDMLKVVNACNDHVISVGASFSTEADSHLVCFQNEEGNYQTQANSKPGKTRTMTGASFVVFNGALKASSGFIAKSSIVEDGLMVQIPPETMESLRTALREQKDFHIPCGKNDEELRENVTVRWVNWSVPVNMGVTSGVDGRPLDGVHSVRMQQDTDFEAEGCTISCTEVFYQLKTPDCSLAKVLPSCSVFQKEMALAGCSALTPHLAVLTSSDINCISLRVSTQADMVEYQAGSGGRLLPQRYMNELDSALIPVIHGGSASVPQTAMDMEFIFYITHSI